MKRVLILAYDYPPYVSVGGLRPHSWFKYMHEFGVFPVVVTRQWSNSYGNYLDYIAPSSSAKTITEESDQGIIIRTPYLPNISNRLLLKYGNTKFGFVRKGISAFFEYGQFPFLMGPKVNLYYEAEKYLKKNKVDIIITTGEPFVLFKYASKLSKDYNIPWIADYRDPWTQDKSRQAKGMSKKMDAFFEKSILSNVSAVTTVSKSFQEEIETLVPNKPFYILPNGYDPEAIKEVEEIKQSDEKLTIGFVGTIYKWHPLESFLRVADDFVNSFPKTPEFEINFYGINDEDSVEELIETKYPSLKSVVKIYPKIPNRTLLEKLATNNLLLLFNYYSYMGTKIYDYLGLKRQILLCYDDDDEANELKRKFYNIEKEQDSEDRHLQKEVIKQTNSGVVVKDAEHLRSVLKNYYSEFESNRFISCNSIDTEQYSRKIQVRRLTEIIREITAEREKA